MSIAERLPATSRLESYGDYIILGYADEDLRFNIGVLESIARRTDVEVFKMEREHSARDVAFNLRNGGSMTVVARVDTLEPVGYSSQRVVVPTIDGSRKRIMFTSTRAIAEDLQGTGIALGPETLRFSFNMHGAPDILAGIVGMPPPVAVYYESGIIAELEGDERISAEANLEATGDEELDQINRQIALVRLYPFFRQYCKSYIMQEARDYVIAQSRYRGHAVTETGVLHSLWDKDSTGLYKPEKASRRVQVLGNLMESKFGLDPTKGDAMVIMAPRTGWRAFRD